MLVGVRAQEQRWLIFRWRCRLQMEINGSWINSEAFVTCGALLGVNVVCVCVGVQL